MIRVGWGFYALYTYYIYLVVVYHRLCQGCLVTQNWLIWISQTTGEPLIISMPACVHCILTCILTALLVLETFQCFIIWRYACVYSLNSAKNYSCSCVCVSYVRLFCSMAMQLHHWRGTSTTISDRLSVTTCLFMCLNFAQDVLINLFLLPSIPDCFPPSLTTLSLAENHVQDLNEVRTCTYICVVPMCVPACPMCVCMHADVCVCVCVCACVCTHHV